MVVGFELGELQAMFVEDGGTLLLGQARSLRETGEHEAELPLEILQRNARVDAGICFVVSLDYLKRRGQH